VIAIPGTTWRSRASAMRRSCTRWVRVGGGYFGISTQLGAGPAGVERLKELAKDALGNIPPTS
jgi:hypothetical protein